MTLLLLAVLAQQPPATVLSVEVRLPARTEAKVLERIGGLVMVRKGQQLSRRAVHRSIENLYATNRFADVEARLETQADGVALIFELTPRQLLADLYVEGNARLSTPEVLAASRLSMGAEFWPERAVLGTEAVRELYVRRGFRDAGVEADIDDGPAGASVGLMIREGPASTMSSLEFAGDPGLTLEDVRAVVGLRPGDVLDLDVVQAGAAALRERLRAERFYRARVEAPLVLDDGRVVVPVVAGPRFSMRFSGNLSVPDGALRSVLGYDGRETFDSSVLQRLLNRLLAFYRSRGFRDARVGSRLVALSEERAAEVVFEIFEGEPTRLGQVNFRGNEVIDGATLRGVLTALTQAAAPETPPDVAALGDALAIEGRTSRTVPQLPAPSPDTVLDDGALAEASRAMTSLYRERGYLAAKVVLEQVELERGLARATFVVSEGSQALFRAVRTRGFPEGFRSEAVDFVRPGDPFSERALEKVRQNVAHELGRRGYVFAQVVADFTLDASGTQVDCLLRVDAGPQVRVRKVVPVGNKRTSDELIIARATMVEGEPLDIDTLYSTQSNLLSLGIFRLVEVEMLAPDTPEPFKTVLLKVREAPRVPEFGVGYFVAEGPRVFGDLSIPNLLGRAVNVSGHVQVNAFFLSVPVLSKAFDVSGIEGWKQIGGRGNISVQNRGVLPADIGVRFDVVGERVFRPQFNFTRFAGVPSLDWARAFTVPRFEWLRPKLTLQLQYELEWASVQRTGLKVNQELPTTFLDQERLRFLFGDFGLQTVRFSPTLDLRDNALNPRKGLLVQGSAEVTGAVVTEGEDGRSVPVSFLKASGLATGYLPIAKTVLAISIRGGRIAPLAANSTTPPVKRFFLGGSTSMRGFNEDQLIAEDQRQAYRTEVRDCQVLAVKEGCSSAARTIANGRQVPSQGGEYFALVKTELRFPATPTIDLGVFAEAGNLWLTAPLGSPNLRWVAGTGLRYGTPIGPLALDLGFNLTPDLVINEPVVVAHFNIGVF